MLTAVLSAALLVAQQPPPIPNYIPLRPVVQSLRFYEGGLDGVAYDQRVYRNTFPLTSRYIYYEVNLSYAKPGRVAKVPILCSFYWPNGEPMGASGGISVIQPEWTSSAFTMGRGYASNPTWSPGSYTVVCFVEERYVMTGTFYLSASATLAPPPPPPLPRILVCVVTGPERSVENVEVTYNPVNGDSTVGGRLFTSVYPSGSWHAQGKSWFINNQALPLFSGRYVKYGLPRILGSSEVTRIASYDGVGVYVEPGAGSRPDVIYLVTRQGCEFQPYQRER